jgi:excisionase family DNA binding protein
MCRELFLSISLFEGAHKIGREKGSERNVATNDQTTPVPDVQEQGYSRPLARPIDVLQKMRAHLETPSGEERIRMRRETQICLELARKLTNTEELCALLADIRFIEGVAWAKLASIRETPREPDHLLNISEAASRLKVSKQYLYRNHKRLPFARHEGRSLRFSAAGLDSYLRRAC